MSLNERRLSFFSISITLTCSLSLSVTSHAHAHAYAQVYTPTHSQAVSSHTLAHTDSHIYRAWEDYGGPQSGRNFPFRSWDTPRPPDLSFTLQLSITGKPGHRYIQIHMHTRMHRHRLMYDSFSMDMHEQTLR